MKPARKGGMPEPAYAARLLPTVAHGLFGFAVALPLATEGAVAAAALGAMLGAFFAPTLFRSSLRAISQVLLVVGVLLAGPVCRALFTETSLAGFFGSPEIALRFGDALLFGFAGMAISLGLRTASLHRRVASGLEVLAFGAALAQLFVAHRDGAIHRPYAIADPIITAGGDPSLLFLAVGTSGVVFLLFLVMRERSWLRSLLHLAFALLLISLFVWTTRMLGVPPVPSGGGLGLGLREGDGESREGEGGQGEGEADPRRNRDDWDFEDHQSSAADRAPVAVVLFHDEYSPPTGIYYFRQSAFSQYNGRRLVAATRRDADRDLARAFPSAPTTVEAPPPTTGRRELSTTVAMLADHVRPFGLAAPERFEPAPNPDPARFRRAYGVRSQVLTTDYASFVGAEMGSATWETSSWEHYTKAPEDPRYRELLGDILENELPEWAREEPVAKVAAITSWLGREGTYSLRSGHTEGDDPTAEFLFGDRVGYCVHFAHAAAYMMRLAGAPARVATGYAVEESARQGGSALMIPAGRAHAWPEVYMRDYGWVVVDVYPENSLDPPTPPPDRDLQRLLGEMARGQQQQGTPGTPSFDDLSRAARSAGRHGGLMVLALVAAVLLSAYAVKLWRRLAPLWVSRAALPRALYRAELDRLSELRYRRYAGETPEAFARRISHLDASLVTLTRLRLAMVFGKGDVPPTISRRSGLRKALRHAVPWHRRMLGALNPFSWILTR